ncbi:MAG: transposase [Proteobacteria bacterium]|jgi:putative transposase|nr:transposase [Pseudomonadota bacterium]MDA1299593.1 transposase [Pseudomonadota bacterium]
MSRPVRIEFPGAIYHITSRGTEGQTVFLDRDDRGVFLNILDNIVSRFGWLIHAYVLMDDHYHLVVEIPQATLSRGMRQLNGVYTQHFNRRHESVGPIFQGRFKSVLFEKEAYLLPVCRHVVLNAVRLGAPSQLTRYRWSSHRATAGQVDPPSFLHTGDVLGAFGKRQRDCQRKYRQFVEAGIDAGSPLDDRQHQVLLGSPAFLKSMAPILQGERMAKRGPRAAQRRRSLTSLFRNVQGQSRSVRNEKIRQAHLDHGYTLMEIGDHLGLHYTTVSKVVNLRTA